MKSALWLLAFLFTQVVWAGGYLEIKCEPGVRIFLGNDFKGATSQAFGGLILEDIPAGSYELKAEKAGFKTQTKTVIVADGKVRTVTLDTFVPGIEIVERGAPAAPQELGTGSLLIQSLPTACTIEIPQLGVSKQKNRDEWEANKVPSGTYEVVLNAMGKTLSTQVTIRKDERTHIFANFVKGKVIDKTAEAKLAQIIAADEAKRQAAVEAEAIQARQKALNIAWQAADEKRIARYQAQEKRNDLLAELLVPRVILLPEGRFMMGEDWKRANMKPVHKVFLNAFWMAETEVTVAQYMKYVEDTGRQIPTYLKRKLPNAPAGGITWHEARQYCEWLSNRTGLHFDLPTEAQWEYACRASSTGSFAENMNDAAWYKANSGGKIHDVATAMPNAWGLYDMQGNVAEWCRDWYGDDYYKTAPTNNPMGPSGGTKRVYRGGSWPYPIDWGRSAHRSGWEPHAQMHTLGFRLMRKVEPGEWHRHAIQGAWFLLGTEQEAGISDDKSMLWQFDAVERVTAEGKEAGKTQTLAAIYQIDDKQLRIEHMQNDKGFLGQDASLKPVVGTRFMKLKDDKSKQTLVFERDSDFLFPEKKESLILGEWHSDDAQQQFTFENATMTIRQTGRGKTMSAMADYEWVHGRLFLENGRGDDANQLPEEIEVDAGTHFMKLSVKGRSFLLHRVR